MGFDKFGLSEKVLEGVRAAGYTTPTPIQTLAIRPVLAGRDLIAGAQTGTGKTAAFVLPILHKLSPEGGKGVHNKPRALVLTPTRELALQVQLASSAYGRFLPLMTVSIYGGVGMDAQVKQLRRGADIVVATPGRLLDHLQQRTVDLSHVQILVLDEADRMLDMGFIRDVRKIIAAVPTERQTLLFSATISPDIKDLAADILHSPQFVEAGERRNPAETVTQHFYSVPRELKTDVLMHALDAESMGSVLVFSRTKHGADKITRRLARLGVNAVTIHSNRTQGQRERALDGFKRGEYRVLVATDIAARGIDVTGISHVINYDVPQYAEDYIHRIGRTGRAGASGDAVTFVSKEESEPLRRIERFIGKRFEIGPYPGAPTQASHPAGQADARAERGSRPGRRGAHGRPTRQPGGETRPKGNARLNLHDEQPAHEGSTGQEEPARHEAPRSHEGRGSHEGPGSQGRSRKPGGAKGPGGPRRSQGQRSHGRPGAQETPGAHERSGHAGKSRGQEGPERHEGQGARESQPAHERRNLRGKPGGHQGAKSQSGEGTSREARDISARTILRGSRRSKPRSGKRKPRGGSDSSGSWSNYPR